MSDSKSKDVEAKKDHTSKTAAKKTAAPVVIERKEKLYSFEQWASMRGIPSQHRPGMRAFVKKVHQNRTLEAWDRCLADY